MQLTVGQIIGKALKAYGVPYVTGLPGHGNWSMIDAFNDPVSKLPFIQVMHEQSAVHIADAHYRVTGQPIAACTSIGPGATNTIIGLATAHCDSTALLLITGSAATHMRGHGVMQELDRFASPDFPHIVAPVTKRTFDVIRADQVPFVLHRAWNAMLTGRPGPVHMEVPLDVQVETTDIDVADLATRLPVGKPRADAQAIEAAIKLLLSAKRPCIVVGGGTISANATPELTTLVENFPGFPDGIQGPELIENMRKQAGRFGAQYQLGHVVGADLSKRPFAISFGKETIYARTLIIASGASARWLGLPGEKALIGHGVSSCATCDGFFFSGKEIAVIGGGDSAMEEAIFLTRFASKVTLIHRRDQFRASKIMLERAQQNKKIEFLTGTVVEDVLDPAKNEVTALKLRNLNTDKAWDFPTSAMFLGIGHIPNASIFEGQLETDQDGYLVTKNNVLTRVPGVYACGDVQDRRYRQAITAAGTGCMAALEAERFLEDAGE